MTVTTRKATHQQPKSLVFATCTLLSYTPTIRVDVQDLPVFDRTIRPQGARLNTSLRHHHLSTVTMCTTNVFTYVYPDGRRVPGPGAVEALRDVWDREMNGDGYRPRWVNARTDAGPIRALTFVINRGGERYAGRLSDADTARHIASACGSTGSCAEYLRRTARSLEKLKLRDHHLERLETLVATEMGVTT